MNIVKVKGKGESMRKRITALGISFIMMMSMVGCGLTDSSSSQKERRTEKASTEAATEPEADVVTSTSTDVDDASGKGGDKADETDKDSSVALNPAFDGIPVIYSVGRTDYVNDDDGEQLYNRVSESLQLMEGTEGTYPGIKKALDTFNKLVNTTSEEYSQSELIDMAKEQKANSEYFTYYSDEFNANIARVDDKVLSICVGSSSYYGGAHGYYGTSGYVFDSQTGEELNILDVVSSKEDLKAAAQEIFSRDYAMLIESEPGCEEYLNESLDKPENLNWCMGPTSLDLYYNPYELACYAAGAQTIQIRYADFPNLFSKGYGESEGNWVKQGSDLMEDITGDGALDYVHFEEDMEYEEEYNYSYINGFTLDTGVESKEIEYYSYGMTPYYIKKDGRFYLYIITEGDSDSSSLLMYEITDGKIVELGDEYAHFSAPSYSFDYGEGYFENCCDEFYNPDAFFLGSRMDLLSTITGIKPSTIGEDGKVKYLQDYYNLSDFIITSKKELTFDEVDEDGNVIGEITVPSGSDYNAYRTDDETYADCKLSDGRIVRLYIERDEELGHVINGEHLEELFDGIIFAG